MKHILTLFILFTGMLSYAQPVMKLHKRDSTTMQFLLAGIDSIHFSPTASPAMHIHQTGDSIQTVLLSDIDSVTHPVFATGWGMPGLIPIAGQVADEDGHPLPGVIIQAGDRMTFSDANGTFYLPHAPVLERLGYVTADKEGYFPGSRTFLPTEGTNTIKIRLLRKNSAGTIVAASGGTVQAEGVSITFPDGGFVQDGTPFHGQVNVTLNYIDPESGHFHSEMPGALLGMMNESNQLLTSYGMVAVELTDNSGSKVELAPGTTAEVHFPLSTTLQADAPAQIDLWYFDEDAGLWMHEGTATRQDNEYVAAVSHFSFWNVDVPEDFVLLNGQVTDPLGNGIAGTEVTIRSSTRGEASAYTGSDGHFGGYVPAGETLSLVVSMQCDTNGAYLEVHTTEIGPFSASEILPPIQLEPGNVTLVTGTITDCDNNPMPTGYILVHGQAYFPDTNGVFSFIACFNILTIRAYSSIPWIIGSPVTLNVTGGNVDVGMLQVCADTLVMGNVTDIDGNVYSTVVIGTQEWMAENLKTTRYRDGSEIPNVTDDAAWEDLSTGAWCNYENSTGYDATYGKLYNWFTVDDQRGLCPAGWHVPSDNEWKILELHLGMSQEEINMGGGVESMRGVSADVGGKMKSVTGWNNFMGYSGNGTNESGFTGLPGGYRTNISTFAGVGTEGYWWSSLRSSPTAAYSRSLNYEYGGAPRLNRFKKWGISVRCVKD